MQTSPKTDSIADSPFRRRMVTIPNLICALRLLGAIALIGIALTGNARLFTAVFAALAFSDWIDGKLARWLNQRSDFGARFDSVADSILFGALFFGIAWLRSDVLWLEVPWWSAAILSYVLTSAFGVWKYGRIPSYHTYGAKASNWLVAIGAICFLLDYSVWPLRIAMVAVTLTNLEAMVITWHLKEWRADVLSIFQVLPRQHRHGHRSP